MDEKFPKKTSTDESKGEMLVDCNHMDQATNMGGHVCTKTLQKILQKSQYIVIVNLEKGVTN